MQVIQLVNIADVHFLFIQLCFVEVLWKRDKEWWSVDMKCFETLIFTVGLVTMNKLIWINQGDLEEKCRMQEITPQYSPQH